MALNTYVRIRCDDSDKNRLAQLAAATQETESEVLRKLIRLGYDQILGDIIARGIAGGAVSEKFDLTLAFDQSPHRKLVRALLEITTYLAAAQRKDLMEEILKITYANDPFTVEKALSLFDVFAKDYEPANSQKTTNLPESIIGEN